MEIKVYVANLGKYNEGELVGEWFTLPVDFEEVAEAIGLDEEYEEYAIHDYEAPTGLKIGQYSSITELNLIAEQIDNLTSHEVEMLELILESGHCTDFDEALQVLNNGEYTVYWECQDMEDVAREYLENTGGLHGVPDHLQNYIDFESYGRDMEINGSFYSVGNHYIEFH